MHDDICLYIVDKQQQKKAMQNKLIDIKELTEGNSLDGNYGVVFTEVELQCHILETYIVLETNFPSNKINLFEFRNKLFVEEKGECKENT